MSDPTRNESSDPRLERLACLIADLREEDSIVEMESMLKEGADPLVLLNCCMDGMRRVGARFESGEYFISALIMAGEIMRVATDLLGPFLTAPASNKSGGKVLLGTIEGDIHDLGKNLFGLLLACHGMEVVDLGVDVPVDRFLEQAKSEQPDIIGISCVLTNSIANMKQAVEKLKKRLPDPAPLIIVGGTCLDEHVAKHIDVEHWARDAATGVTICKDLLAKA